MAREIHPKDTERNMAYELWMKAPNPMVTFFKTLDVTNIVKVSKKKNMKLNMLLDYCIGKAAANVKEFYILPVGDKLMQYDTIAVNTIVKNKNDEVSSCDIMQADDLTIKIRTSNIISVPPYANGWSACRKIFSEPAK